MKDLRLVLDFPGGRPGFLWTGGARGGVGGLLCTGGAGGGVGDNTRGDMSGDIGVIETSEVSGED